MSLFRAQWSICLNALSEKKTAPGQAPQPLSMTAGTGMRLGFSAGRNFQPGELFFGMELVAELDATTQGPSSNEQ